MVFVIVFFIGHWYLSLFSQTFFLHRYAAHASFTMNKAWEKVFYVFTYITQGSSYMSPRAYAIMHRMHHAYTDTELDPHSPAYDKNLFAMMWRTKNIYSDIFYKRYPIEKKFAKNLPEWRWFDAFGHSWFSRFMWIGIYTALYLLFAPSPWFLLILPLHMVMGPLHGVIINWYAHKYGSVNHDMENTSKNLFKVDWLMMGEGYHNNHHKYPSKTNFASKKGEIDLCYPVIYLLGKLKIIRPVAKALVRVEEHA